MIEGAKGSGIGVGGSVDARGEAVFGRVVRVVEEDEMATQRAFAGLT